MIWVIAGTLDGRTLAVDIQSGQVRVLVTVVSQYGAELAAAHKALLFLAGRLDQSYAKFD